jgi:hypothetical protein
MIAELPGFEMQFFNNFPHHKNGFPLGLHSFEGNKAETKTLLPVIEAF